MIIAFVCPHCGHLATDDTQFMLDDGCTLRCSDCGGFAVVGLTPIVADGASTALEDSPF